MEWLNYHHLLYFWTIAREGGVTRAAEKLRLAQPTLSTQLRQLEESLGAKLFAKAGRGLTLTDTGKVVFRYADEIFGLGRELQDVVAGRVVARPEAFVVGVSDVLSKLLVHRLLQPAFEAPEPPRLVCREETLEVLLDDLVRHEVDLVLADHPLPPKSRIKAYSHLLGESGMDWFAAPGLIRKHREPFPRCLEGAPVLLPAAGTALRDALDGWFVVQDLRVKVVGEFDDSALLKAFGQEGTGFFPGPSVLALEIQLQHKVNRVGSAPGLRSQIYAISVERRVKHPAVVAILKHAKKGVFKTEG